MSSHNSHHPRKNPRGGEGRCEEARLKEGNRKCRTDDGRRRRSDLTSPSQRGEAGGRGGEKLNSFISPRRPQQQPPQRSINTCTLKVLGWSVRCGTDSVEKRSVSTGKQHSSKTPGQEENVRTEEVCKTSGFFLI